MIESDAVALAERLLQEFNLKDWRVEIDPRATRRFGQCRYSTRAIGLSRKLVALNPAAEVENTIRHEIAHALAGPNAGHGPRWRAMCRVTGARPERCYADSQVVIPAGTWRFTCDRCDIVGSRMRKPRAPMVHAPTCGGHILWKRA